MQNIELIFCIFFRCFFRRAGVTYINRVAWLHAGEFGSVVQPSAGRTKGARSAAGCSRSREKDRNARFTRYSLRRLLSEQTTHAVRQPAAALGRKTATRASLDTASAGCCPNKQRMLYGGSQPPPGGGLLASFARLLRSAAGCSGNSHAVRRAAASPREGPPVASAPASLRKLRPKVRFEDTPARQKTSTLVFALAYPYLWLRRRYSVSAEASIACFGTQLFVSLS